MEKMKTKALPLVGGSTSKHSVCYQCWCLDNPDKHPFVGDDAPWSYDRIEQQCCLCDRTHQSGIYVTIAPESSRLLCKKRH